MKRNKASYVSGAAALLLSSVTVKILGALFKIPLTNLIGDSGMGLFAFAMQFFSLLFVISAAGLPAAQAHLVSEALALGRREQAKAITVRAVSVFAVTSLLLSLALAGAAPTLCRLFGQTAAVPCLLLIAPAVFLVTVEAALRGWYQGTGDMVPTAISQVAEAVGKLVVGLFAASTLLNAGYGIAGAAAGAVFGVTCGELVAVLYLLWSVRRGAWQVIRHPPKEQHEFSKLVQLMIPVTLGAAVMTVSGFLDMSVVYRRLPVAGFSAQEVVAAYGAYTGMALTLFNLPQSLSNAVSVSVLPALSAAHAKKQDKQIKRLLRSSMGLTLLVCIPCGIGLFVLAGPLLQLLFASQPHGVQTATPLLRLLGVAEPLVGLSTVTISILQAFGRPDLSVYAMTVACTVKFAVGFYLAGQPNINILALPIGTLTCYSLLLVINLAFIAHVLHPRR